MTRRDPSQWWTESCNDVTGCTPAGAGYAHCWPRDMAQRFSTVHDGPWSEVRLHPERMEAALHWRKPRVIARSLLGDVFHEAVGYKHNDRALHIVHRTKQHQHVWLTKRFDRAIFWAQGITAAITDWQPRWQPPSNLLLMFSASVQTEVDAACRAGVELSPGWRWGLHMEPLLGPVTLALADVSCDECGHPPARGNVVYCDSGARPLCRTCQTALNGKPLVRPAWIVIGAENGPKRRPMDHAWARNIIEQCQDGGVPVWLKAWHEPPAWVGEVPREAPWRVERPQ